MSGIFGKIKEKKAEWERKSEEIKVTQIQMQIDKNFEKFKKDFGKHLRKLGLSLTYVGLSEVDAKARNAGSIIARFNDNEGYPITLVQTQAVYEGTPHGALAEMRKVYWSSAFWSTIVQSPIPFTILFKRVYKDWRHTIYFLPLSSLPFNEEEVPKSPLMQTPILVALNADEKLCNAVDRFSLKFTLNLTSKEWLTLSCPDIAGKCLIVPAGDETAVFLRNYGGYGDVKETLEAFSRIRRHILGNPRPEKVTGIIPVFWFNAIYALAKAEFPRA